MDNFGKLEDARNREPTDNLATDAKIPTPNKFPFTRSWADMENNDANSSSIYDTNEQEKLQARAKVGAAERKIKSELLTIVEPEDIEPPLDEPKNPPSHDKMVHMIRIKEISSFPYYSNFRS